MKNKLSAPALAIMLLSSGQASAMGLDAYMPGEMMGMAMTQSVFGAFFSDKEGLVARPASEFMTMYNQMSAADKMVVRIACSIQDEARKGFSDRISASCRAAGF